MDKEPYRSKEMRLYGRCTPPPLPKKYSIAKVRKRFDEIYNAEVVKVPRLYKSRWQYHERYNVIDKATGEVLIENAILFALGDYLDSQGEYDYVEDVEDTEDTEAIEDTEDTE